MARVLVTGATGCLGYRLAHDLISQGHEVIAHARGAAATLADRGARIVLADLRDGFAPDNLRGLDTIYHCAALSTAWAPPADFMAINVTATAHLLAMAKAQGVRRFVFASSPSIYADGTDRFDVDEDATLPRVFVGPYARSKYLAERLVRDADTVGGMRTVVIRPRAIYGTGDRSLMPRLLMAMKRGFVPMIERGQSMIDLTHVSDAANAMICAGTVPDVGGRVYNVTSGEIWRFSEILDAVCAATGQRPRRINIPYRVAMGSAGALETFHRAFIPAREPVLSRQVVASLGRSLTLDISRARSQLGYAPRVTMHQGIKDYADAR